MMKNAKLLLLAAVLSSHGLGAASQDISEELVEDLRNSFEDGEIVELFQGLNLLGVAPGVSGASYTIKSDEPGASDLEIKSIRVPFSREFDRGAFCVVEADDQDRSDYQLEPVGRSLSSNALCMKPYAELSLSYLRAEQGFDFADVGAEFAFDVTTLSALAGVGLSIPLSKNTTLRPILLGGYSRIDSDATFDGDLAAELDQGLQGILDNADLNAVLVGGAVELRHERPFINDIELQGRLRYNHFVSNIYDASNESLERTDNLVVVTGNLEASVPTGLKFLSQNLHAQGFGSSTFLLTGSDDKIDGTNFIHELGAGLKLDSPAIVKAVTLRASALFGEDLTGWRAGLAVKF